ncbi:hypothetical protein LX73_0773 [Fodinibius salinus]|uniref:HPt (Histidine-containing phosphotransfer) domain-containing protein n=1 Tax=Fodinibius salinus TaxID=860790 RepID=A0A5D3YQB5_9BACT|nr:taurine dioxygenase [Fodinibius salinus]TYP95468.1 hypothetical protein LX73_0773 [Fodinibius salinus]
MSYQIIKPQENLDMILGAPEHVVEFCEAAIESITEFKTNFHKHLTDRNIEELRGAGHKIKPGAQMMGADIVLENYEHGKDLIKEEADQEELKALANEMDEICTKIKEDLDKLVEEKG